MEEELVIGGKTVRYVEGVEQRIQPVKNTLISNKVSQGLNECSGFNVNSAGDSTRRRRTSMLGKRRPSIEAQSAFLESPKQAFLFRVIAGACSSNILEQLTNGSQADLLQHILSCLSLPQLLQASQVCKSWAEAAELIFKQECDQRRWNLPRFPRGLSCKVCFPWRSLYSKRACRSCGLRGEFPVRHEAAMQYAPLKFTLCKICINKEVVRRRLVRENLHVDLIGVTGKKLFPVKKKRGRN